MVADMAADMEVHMVADMEVRGACKKEEEERVLNLVRELVNWAQTFWTRRFTRLVFSSKLCEFILNLLFLCQVHIIEVAQ